jgi:hypothetical protein
MKIKEGRDIYVTDETLALVYDCASPVIQDAIGLAYLTGQRPADVLKMRWDQVKDGSLWLEQSKGKVKLQIAVVGELAALIDRFKSRGLVGMTTTCESEGATVKAFGLLSQPIQSCQGSGGETRRGNGHSAYPLPIPGSAGKERFGYGEYGRCR